MAAAPVFAASHTISSGVVVYDSASFSSDDILVDGATATLQINGGGLILTNAVSLDNGGTLDNAGSISRSGPGVSGTTGTVTNRDGGTIGSLDDYGVYFLLGGTVNNGAGSSISGTTGIYSDYPDGSGPTSVTNAGTITATGTADPSAGVDLENGGTVLNQDGGTINGGFYGILGWEGVDVTNTGAGSLIHGGNQGVSLLDGGSLDNLDGAGITSDQVGVGTFYESADITNGGGATIIGSNNDGIYFAAGGTLLNTGVGSLVKGGWNGIRLEGGGTVTNEDGAEIIAGRGNSAAAIYLVDGGTVINGAGSRIVGDSSVGTYGVYASQDATITNAGTIVGDVRLADDLENHVTLFTGSHIEGDLYASTRNEDSTLTLDGAGIQLFSAAVSGATTFYNGTLVKTGSGTWIMDTDDQGIAPDAVVIEQGTLDTRHYNSVVLGGIFTIPQALSAAAVTIENGAVLLGDGRIGGLVVKSGAIVAPGHSTGTLTIGGDYQPVSGSIYEAQISGDGTSDLIDASGTATITAGAKLTASKYGAMPLTVGTKYTVLTANHVTGTYTVLDNGAVTAFLRADASYDSKHAYLTVAQSRDLAAAGTTPNQRVAASGLQSTPSGNSTHIAALNLPDDATAGAAFDSLSGEIHASLRGALLLDARAPREAALDRLRAALGHGAEVWSRAYGALDDVASDRNGAAIDNRTGGFLFGADLPLGKSGRIGVFGGTGYDGIASRGTARSGDFTLGAYGGNRFGPLAVRLGGAVTTHEIATSRTADLAGSTTNLSAAYGGTTAQIFGEAGYVIDAGPLAFEPYAGVSYAALRTGGFSEGGNRGLIAAAQTSSLATTTLGLRASADFNALHIGGSLGWQHLLGATTPTSTQHFPGGTDFTIAGAALPRDSVLAGLDLDLKLSDAANLTLNYAGSFAPTGNSQSATAQFRLRF